MPQLVVLPPELILHIYKEVPSRERKHLRLLCTYFNNTLREDVLSSLRIDIHALLFFLHCDIIAFQNLVRTTSSRRSLSVVMIKPANGLLVKTPTLPRIDETTLDLLSKILYSVHELRSFSWTLHYGASRHGIPLMVDWIKKLKGLREINLHLMDHVPSMGLGLHSSSVSSLKKLQVVSTGSKSMFNEGTLVDDVAAIIADAPQLREIVAIQDNSVDIFANVVHNLSRTSDAAVLFSRVKGDRISALTTLVLEGHPIRCLTPNVLFCMHALCHFAYLPPDKPAVGTHGYIQVNQDNSAPIWTTLNAEKLYHLQMLKTSALHDTLWPYLAKLSSLKRLHLIPQRPAHDRQDETMLEKFRGVVLPALASQLEELVVTAPSGSSCWCFENGLGEALKEHGRGLGRLKYLGVTLSAPGDCDWNRPSVVQIYSSRGSPEWHPKEVFEKVEKSKEKWASEGCDGDNVWVRGFLIHLRGDMLLMHPFGS
ncbi:hypothetical protein BJ165DRAFT_707936 [Panaeolus papilionaceus]|nr:hypothetical protein BJ165DRAFT_707936 [Panaeolus papilionaceus]